MSENKTVYVITWKYLDNSAYGVVRVFSSEESANKILKLLEDFGDSLKSFSVFIRVLED